MLLAVPVVAALARLMVPDVLVGRADLPARRVVPCGDPDTLHTLRGDVLVADCRQPEIWVPELARLHRAARVGRAVVAAPAAVWAPWFRTMADESWDVCFLHGHRLRTGTGVLLGHVGAHREAFRVVLEPFGSLMQWKP